ncbi:MAG: efflux RND transporter periplasmic adaptor subunit [Synergistales bacterium]|nr:efflux RND transporter periplasmic adaptor subunit [Synergistales bacterium]MDY6400910.1 efflux RND transporter periplasmic adaptor subunit [Synergistales bacterium]MDY6405384.1 efflux RND transporter periplasmic adaptor subunit [Synergistales bacterium]MDY6410067.1 efflux RND transporter periplasmic adaptor subunit [Synergistales bacterium]MDY6413717.1 efflux RND transporter periplasmic adaptor subunit [Synergistales bacterium]
MKKLIEIIILAGLVFGAYRGLEIMRGQKDEVPQKEVIRPVKTVVLRSNGKGGLWQYYGTLQGGRRVDLSFRVAGPIRSVNVDRGASVKKGQLLATLDPRDYQTQLKQAQSNQAQAQAQYENAEANFKRYENLYKRKVVPKSTYDTYKTEMNVARSALNVAKGTTTAVRDSLKDTELRAPFDGVIVDRLVENFQDVNASQTIFILQDISMLEIVFNIPENDVIWASKAAAADAAADKSSPLLVRAKFDAIPGKSFPLTFKEVVLQADRNTNTFPVTAVMPQQDNVALLPGMNATVEVELPDTENGEKVFTVPQNAVVTSGDKTYVWRCNNNVVERVSVTQNTPHNNGFIEISSEQLQDGNIIVVAGAHLLHEGQKVRM